MDNETLLKKDLTIIIKLATDILLKDDLSTKDIVTTNELETAFKIKKLLTLIDNNTNIKLPF